MPELAGRNFDEAEVVGFLSEVGHALLRDECEEIS
jgi:hypothetical protein